MGASDHFYAPAGEEHGEYVREMAERSGGLGHAAAAIAGAIDDLAQHVHASSQLISKSQPFLLQTYRRDMGGGQFVIMKDLSAPITVYGRRWGGLRPAYRFD